MTAMNWFDKLLPKIKSDTGLTKRGVPEGLWRKCDACQAVLYGDDLIRSLHVCPKCDHHMRIGARERLTALFDDGRFDEVGADIRPVDMLKFRDTKRYRDRLYEAGKNTAETEALLVGAGALQGRPLVSAAFEFRYMGGSMGSVVGERFVRATDAAIERHAPLVCFAASGGARMQEGLFSLMQMAKTSAALTDLAAARLPFVSVLTDPTMGGVSASLAMLGDVIIAEPDALVGFAGQRVIEQTVREKLPEGFQRAEFLLEHGAIDMIVDRRRLRERLHNLLELLMATDAAASPAPPTVEVPAEPEVTENSPESDV